MNYDKGFISSRGKPLFAGGGSDKRLDADGGGFTIVVYIVLGGMNMKKKVAVYTVILTCLVLFFSIGVQAGSISISRTKATMYARAQLKLSVSSKSKNVTWASSNKSVAVVSKKGLVTAKKPGKVTITAKVGKKKLKCRITVKKWQGNVDLMSLLGKRYSSVKKKVPCMRKKAPGYYGDGGANITTNASKVVVVDMSKYIAGYHFRGVRVGMNYKRAEQILKKKGFHLVLDAGYGNIIRYYRRGKESIQINSYDWEKVSYVHGTIVN